MLSRLIVLSFLMGFFNIAHAGGKFTFVQEQEPAPFTGTLFDPEATAKILANVKFTREQYALALAFELSAQEWAFRLEMDQMEITLDTERKRYESTLELKNKEIDKLNTIIAKKPGTNSLIWGVVGGFLAGAGATVAVVHAVNK